jgi:demethylspheroidene O-methyltransferase
MPVSRSVLDVVRGWRDALISSARFQQWAAAFPLTRPLARRHARAVFDLAAGFVYSQVLLACVQLDAFRILAGGPLGVAAFAHRTGLGLDAARRLLEAAASLRLLESRGPDRYGLGPLGAAILGNPGIVAMVRHHPMLYSDLRDPVALLRGDAEPTQLSRYWPYATAASPSSVSTAEVNEYTQLMSASQTLISEEVLAAYDFGRHRCLLDVGGGDGTFAAAVAARHDALHLQLFDLPAVAAQAQQRFEAARLASRARAIGGDFLRDPLPQGADVVSLVRVLHDHDDERVLAVLRAIRRILPDEGTLVIAEPLAETAGAETVGGAYFGFYLLAMGRGQARSVAQLAQLLAAAGFDPPRRLATRIPLQTSVLSVRPRSAGVRR